VDMAELSPEVQEFPEAVVPHPRSAIRSGAGPLSGGGPDSY
jgi:hypothetical protein